MAEEILESQGSAEVPQEQPQTEEQPQEQVQIEDQEQQQQLPEPPKKMSVKDFASKIKAKYPAYANIEDNQLVSKMLEKYPVYKDKVEFGQPTQELPAQPPKKSWAETSALSPMAAIKPKPEQKGLAPVTAPPVKREKPKPQQPSDDTFKSLVENPIVGAGLSMLGGIGGATKVAGMLEGTGAVDYGKYVWNKLVGTGAKMPAGALEGVVRLSSAITDFAFKGLGVNEDVRNAILNPIVKDADETAKKIKETAKVAQLPLEEKRKQDFDNNFAASAVASIPSLALQATVPLGMGFASDAFDTAIENINNTEAGKNLPESIKTVYGTANATTMAVLSEIGLDKIVGGKLMPKLSSKLTAETITDLLGKSSEPITKEVFEAALKTNANNLKNRLITNAGKLGHSAAVGSAFMGANEALNIMSEKLTNKLAKQDVFEPTGFGESFMRVVKAGAEGAGFGLVMGGVHVPFGKADNYIKSKVAESKSIDDINAIKNEIAENVKSGKINQNQSDIMNNLVDEYANIHASIPQDIPNKENVIDKIKQSNDIRQQAQDIATQSVSLHPAFQEQRLKEIEALNKSADDIDSSIAGKSKYKIGEQDVDKETFVNYIMSPELKGDVELSVENDPETSGLLNRVGQEKNLIVNDFKEEGLPDVTILSKGVKATEPTPQLPQVKEGEKVYRVEYTDPKTGERTSKLFINAEEGKKFQDFIADPKNEWNAPRETNAYYEKYDGTTKLEIYDTENITGIPSKVGVGEKPIEAQPVEGGGAQAIGGGGILQENVPSREGEVAKEAPQVAELPKTEKETQVSGEVPKEITFQTSAGDKATGEKITIPGYENMDFVAKRDGMNYDVYELSTGMKVSPTSSFTIEEAISQTANDLASKNVTPEKIYNKIYSSEKTMGRVKALNKSESYERFKQQKIAEEENKPYIHTEEERKKLLDLSEKAKSEGLTTAENIITSAANRRSGEKVTIERANEIYQENKNRVAREKLISENKPLDKIELMDDSEDALKKTINREYESDKYTLIPEKIRSIAYSGFKKMIAIRNKYGYYPKSIKNMEVPPDMALAIYSRATRAKNVENRGIRISEAEKSLLKSVDKINEIYNSEFREPAREEAGGAIQAMPGFPEEQKVKEGLQPSTEPISRGKAETTTAVLSKDNIFPFETKSKKQIVSREKEGGLVEVTNKEGKKVSRTTEKKALREYAQAFDFSKGETAEDVATKKELLLNSIGDVIDASENPLELAEIYVNEEPTTQSLSATEAMIGEFGVENIKPESFARYNDRNNITQTLAKTYLGRSKSAFERLKYDNRRGLDVLAKEMSEHYFPEGDGTEISPEDIADFMVRFPDGKWDKLTESENATSAANKFQKLTGLILNREIADIVINKKFEKIAQQENAVKQLLEKDYENESELNAEYMDLAQKTNGFEPGEYQLPNGGKITVEQDGSIKTEKYETETDKITKEVPISEIAREGAEAKGAREVATEPRAAEPKPIKPIEPAEPGRVEGGIKEEEKQPTERIVYVDQAGNIHRFNTDSEYVNFLNNEAYKIKGNFPSGIISINGEPKMVLEPNQENAEFIKEYKKAKSEGTNPALVKTVEDIIGQRELPEKEIKPEPKPEPKPRGKKPGKYESRAIKIAEDIMKLELPDWMKVEGAEDIKKAGVSGEELKKALADAVVTMGKLLDKGVEFSQALKTSVKDLVKIHGEDKREAIEKGFEKYYNEKVAEEMNGAEPPKPPIPEKETSPEFNDDMTKMANAVNDAYIEGKFGIKALDDVLAKLQDTSISDIYESVKKAIESNYNLIKETKDRILTTGKGNERDQAILLYDLAELKGKEDQIQKSIIEETDPVKQAKLQDDLLAVQNEIMDNAVANRMIGRTASNIFRLRQVWANREADLVQMTQQYKASKGLKELTPKQERDIKNAYDRLREAKAKMNKLKQELIEALEREEKLKKEAKVVEKIKVEAKEIKKKERAKTSEKKIQESQKRIQDAKDRLRQIRNNMNDVMRVVPETALEISKIAAEKFYQGVVKFDEIVKNVYDEVKDVFPEWTEKDVRRHLLPESDIEAFYEGREELPKTAEDVKTKLNAYQRAQSEYANLMFEWQKDRASDIMEKKPFNQRIIDSILRWQRFAVLSYPSTILKLATVVGHQLTLKPLKFGAQYLQNLMLKGISPEAAKKQQIFGTPSLKALSKYYSEFIRNFSAENLKEQFSGIDRKEILYGKKFMYDEWAASKGFLEIPGRAHGYIKSFIKNPEFQFAHEQLVSWHINRMAEIEKELKQPNITSERKAELEKEYKENDVTNDEVLDKINSQALAHSKWSIMMNDNKFVDKFRQFTKSIGGVGGALIQSELPIVKIPVNYVGRVFAMKYGLIEAIKGKGGEKGYPGIVNIIRKGTDNLTNQQADLLGKSLTLGSIGASFFLIGYANRKNIKQNEDGSYEIMGNHVSKNLIHSPEIETILNGALMGNKHDGGDNFLLSWMKSDWHIIENNPFFNMLTYGFIPNVAMALIKKHGEGKVEDKISDATARKITDIAIPGFVKQIAQWSDVEGGGFKPTGEVIKRKPEGTNLEKAIQTFELAVPGLRQRVPETGETETILKSPNISKLKQYNVEPPKFGSKNKYKIKVDSKHPKQGSDKQGNDYSYLTDKEWKQFNDYKKDYLDKALGAVYNSDVKLNKELLESALEKINKQSILVAKSKMGLWEKDIEAEEEISDEKELINETLKELYESEKQ